MATSSNVINLITDKPALRYFQSARMLKTGRGISTGWTPIVWHKEEIEQLQRMMHFNTLKYARLLSNHLAPDAFHLSNSNQSAPMELNPFLDALRSNQIPDLELTDYVKFIPMPEITVNQHLNATT